MLFDLKQGKRKYKSHYLRIFPQLSCSSVCIKKLLKKEAWKCNYPAFLANHDRQTDRPTNQPTDQTVNKRAGARAQSKGLDLKRVKFLSRL